MTKSQRQRFFRARKAYYDTFGESIVDVAMRIYDKHQGEAIYYLIAEELKISKQWAWEMIKIGKKRREKMLANQPEN